MADKKSQKVIKVVLPKGQQTLFSEPDLKSIEQAVQKIGVAYTNISDKQDGFFRSTKHNADNAVKSLNAVATAAEAAKNAIAAMPKTPSPPSGTGGTSGSSSGGQRKPRAQKTATPTVNPVAAAMASSGQSSAIEPVASGLSSAGKRAASEAKAKAAKAAKDEAWLQAEIAKEQAKADAAKLKAANDAAAAAKEAGRRQAAANEPRRLQQKLFAMESANPSGRNDPSGPSIGGFSGVPSSIQGRATPTGKALTTAEKQAEAARIAKAKADEEFAKKWLASAASDAKKQEADYAKSQKAIADAEKKKAAADKKFADDWIREQQENAKKQEKDSRNDPRSPSYKAYWDKQEEIDRNVAHGAFEALNTKKTEQSSRRFGDRQDAYDDAVQKIRKGKGLYEVSQDLTSTHVEAAFDEADELVRKDIQDALKRRSSAKKDLKSATASGDTKAVKAAKEKIAITKEEVDVLLVRRNQNKQFSEQVRKTDEAYLAALVARNKALSKFNSESNPILKKKAEFDLQTKQKQLDQAHREKQAVRNPNAASKGFGGQNLTFAAQQAAYGVEDFFQVLAAGQSPVRAFLGAANNIGPALALVGVSSVTASVGIAGLLAATALFASKGVKAKKEIDDIRKSIDALEDSASKVERLRIRIGSTFGDDLVGVGDALGEIGKELLPINSRLEKSRELAYESRKEAFAPRRSQDPTLGRGSRAASLFVEGMSDSWRNIKTQFDRTAEGAGFGFNDSRKSTGERYQGPRSIGNIKADNPQLQGGAFKSALRAGLAPVGAQGLVDLLGGFNESRMREKLEKLQQEFDKNKELGVYKDMQDTLKDLDDRVKMRSELLKKAASNQNFTGDAYDFSSSVERKTGIGGLRTGAVQSAVQSRMQIEKDIREAEEALSELLPEYEKKAKELAEELDQLSFKNLSESIKKANPNLSDDEVKIEVQETQAVRRQLAADRLRAAEDQIELLRSQPATFKAIRDKRERDFASSLSKAGFGLRAFNQMLPGVVNESLFRLDDIKQSREALKESFNASSAGDQQTILKQLDNAARPKGTAQVMGVEGLYNTIQTSLLNNDPSLEVEKQIRDEIKALRDDLARGAKIPGRAMGGMIRGYAEGGRADARDTIPARLRPGEVVLTPQQQQRIGQNAGKRPAEIFGEAGVPGFAGGGKAKRQPAWEWWKNELPDEDDPGARPLAYNEPRPTATHPQSSAFGAGPPIGSVSPRTSSSSKRLTPFQQRNEYIKAMRKRQQEVVAKKNAEQAAEKRRNLFVGPISQYEGLRRPGIETGFGSVPDPQTNEERALRRKVNQDRLAAISSVQREKMGYGAKPGALSKEESATKRAEMLARKKLSDAQEAVQAKKTAAIKTDWRSGGNNPIPKLGYTSADIARSMRTGKPEGEGTTAWKYEGPASSGIMPRIDYSTGGGSTVRGRTRTNSWMEKATPEFSREASTLMDHKTGRYTKGTPQREKQVAGLLSDMQATAKPNYSAGENTEYRGWKAGQDEVKGMPKIEYGKDALKAQEERMDRLGIGGADVSYKGMEVSLKDGLDNSKVLTDILRTLNEKLGMISSGVGQTVGAIQSMETGGLI